MESKKKDWVNFLNPEKLGGSLVVSSLYISIYESFRDYVENLVKDFFLVGFENGKDIYSDKYDIEMEKIRKNFRKRIPPVRIALEWLKLSNIINDKDIESFETFYKIRNEIAHDMMSILFQDRTDEILEVLTSLSDLYIKISKNWFIEVEASIQGISVEKEAVVPYIEVLMKIIFDILTGNEEEAYSYYNEYKEKMMNI